LDLGFNRLLKKLQLCQKDKFIELKHIAEPKAILYLM